MVTNDLITTHIIIEQFSKDNIFNWGDRIGSNSRVCDSR